VYIYVYIYIYIFTFVIFQCKKFKQFCFRLLQEHPGQKRSVPYRRLSK